MKNEELKKQLEEKDMQHELELIGKEEYTKASMGEIIEHYYTANEDCIPISVIQNKKRELEKKKEYLWDEYDESVVEVMCRYSSAIKVLDEILEKGNK